MTAFFKLSGAGNDFIALVAPETAPSVQLIRTWCSRRVSLGADGLFVIERGDGSSVSMTYFNADGQASDLCLNGTRCAARLAFELGWAERRLVIETAAGAIEAERLETDSIRTRVAVPEAWPSPEPIELQEGTIDGYRAVVGVPHYVVVARQPLGAVDVARLGKTLRWHQAFQPEGTNVDFVRFIGERELELRTYERGVEAETLACGTGTLAAVAVGLETGRSRLPVRVKSSSGFWLEVDGLTEATELTSWSLTGDARIVAEGELHVPSLLPEPFDFSE